MSNVLPKNASKLEKQLAELSARIAKIAVPFVAMQHVEDCPAPFLPWLAWSKRVDFWSSAWSDRQKRQAIADSKIYNQRRGTEYSLNIALSQVAASYQIKAWHELNPKGTPYSFSVQLPTSQPLTIEQAEAILVAIDSAKSARDVYSVRATIKTQATTYAAGAAKQGQRVRMSSID